MGDSTADHRRPIRAFDIQGTQFDKNSAIRLGSNRFGRDRREPVRALECLVLVWLWRRKDEQANKRRMKNNVFYQTKPSGY
jgi:hypothetical protein